MIPAAQIRSMTKEAGKIMKKVRGVGKWLMSPKSARSATDVGRLGRPGRGATISELAARTKVGHVKQAGGGLGKAVQTLREGGAPLGKRLRMAAGDVKRQWFRKKKPAQVL